MRCALACLLVAALAAPALAQPDSAPQAQLRRAFESGPGIGQPLPDATVYTAEGKPLRLHDLRGQPTVLVFGCLT